MRKRTIPAVKVEAAALESDVRTIVARSSTRARALSELGASMEGAIGELFHDASASELRGAATQLQSNVHYVVSLALELATHAGELEQVASFYESADALGRDPD